jgi:uncharacterized protein (TIGR02453 family)
MKSSAARFEGFSRDGIGFFRALALQQNREWFQAHKHEYEELWVQPMKALMESLRGRLTKLYRGEKLNPVKVFRLNRDVRFSADKSPYKTQCAAVVGIARGEGPFGGPVALYIHLGTSDKADIAAAGHYMLEPEVLARYRKLVQDEKQGPKLAALVKTAEGKGLTLGAMESVKTAPRGIDPKHPRIALLRHKGLALTFPKIPRAVRFSAKLEDWLFEQCKLSYPVTAWGLKHLS